MAYCSTVLGSSEVLRVDVHRKHRLDSCVFLPDELVGRHDGADVRHPRLGENVDLTIISVTSIELNSSGSRAQKRNITNSLINYKSRGVMMRLRDRRLYLHNILMSLGVHSKCWGQLQRKHACPDSI